MDEFLERFKESYKSEIPTNLKLILEIAEYTNPASVARLDMEYLEKMVINIKTIIINCQIIKPFEDPSKFYFLPGMKAQISALMEFSRKTLNTSVSFPHYFREFRNEGV